MVAVLVWRVWSLAGALRRCSCKSRFVFEPRHHVCLDDVALFFLFAKGMR